MQASLPLSKKLHISFAISMIILSVMMPLGLRAQSVQAPTVTANADLNNLTCGQMVTLTAQGNADEYYWYSDANCTNPLGTGQTYTFQVNEQPITIYCKAGRVITPASSGSQDFSYTGGVQTYDIQSGVQYILEVWGAQGGNADSRYSGGKGGYSIGTISSPAAGTLYVCVGGQGTSDNGSYSSSTLLSGGWNGGGAGRAWSGTNRIGGGGGGATHIAKAAPSSGSNYQLRYYSSNQSDVVIVAGGGGGASDNGNGGAGGGVSGITGSGSGGCTPGTQSSGSAWGYATDCTYSGGECGGGGGGYYGGYSASSENYAGGGGSGYVNSTLTDAQTIAGNTSFPSVSGGNETGHAGNGYARITYVIPEVVTYSSAVSITASANLLPSLPMVEVTNACFGQDAFLTVTNAVNGLTYGWWDNASCTGTPLHEGSTYTISNIQNSTTLYVRAYSGTMIPVRNFEYTGAEQVLQLPTGASSITLEVWGAQGGGQPFTSNSQAGIGGYGGYSYGTMPVNGTETLYIYVGGHG